MMKKLQGTQLSLFDFSTTFPKEDDRQQSRYLGSESHEQILEKARVPKKWLPEEKRRSQEQWKEISFWAENIQRRFSFSELDFFEKKYLSEFNQDKLHKTILNSKSLSYWMMPHKKEYLAILKQMVQIKNIPIRKIIKCSLCEFIDFYEWCHYQKILPWLTQYLLTEISLLIFTDFDQYYPTSQFSKWFFQILSHLTDQETAIQEQQKSILQVCIQSSIPPQALAVVAPLISHKLLDYPVFTWEFFRDETNQIEENSNISLDESALSVDKILNVLMKDQSISLEMIHGHTREARVVKIRHYAFYLIRNLLDWSLVKIATYFQRDHTSILHALKKIQSHPSAMQELEKIKLKLLK
jgi:hypothetical protein